MTAKGDDSYTVGEPSFDINVRFSENIFLDAGETVRLVLHSGATIDVGSAAITDDTIAFAYSIGAGQNAFRIAEWKRIYTLGWSVPVRGEVTRYAGSPST